MLYSSISLSVHLLPNPVDSILFTTHIKNLTTISTGITQSNPHWKLQNKKEGCGYSSVVKHLPSMCKALSLNTSEGGTEEGGREAGKQEGRRAGGQEGRKAGRQERRQEGRQAGKE
jgi:hypothetical protein